MTMETVRVAWKQTIMWCCYGTSSSNSSESLKKMKSDDWSVKTWFSAEKSSGMSIRHSARSTKRFKRRNRWPKQNKTSLTISKRALVSSAKVATPSFLTRSFTFSFRTCRKRRSTLAWIRIHWFLPIQTGTKRYSNSSIKKQTDLNQQWLVFQAHHQRCRTRWRETVIQLGLIRRCALHSTAPKVGSTTRRVGLWTSLMWKMCWIWAKRTWKL